MLTCAHQDDFDLPLRTHGLLLDLVAIPISLRCELIANFDVLVRLVASCRVQRLGL
jgi:hypothetical protein